MKAIDIALKNPLLLNLLTLLVLVAGVFTATTINREAFPAVDFDTVMISTIYPGASPKEVELYVTNRLEDEIKSVDGIKKMESTSTENVSVIVINLEPDLSHEEKTNAINQIQNAVKNVQDLPEEVTESPNVTEINSGVMPVMELGLSAEGSYEALHKMADEIIDKIKKLPEAKEPLTYGFYDKEFWVELDPKKLKRQHVGLNAIIGALATQNLNLPGGILKSPEGDYLVRTIGQVQSAKEIDEIVVRSNDAGLEVKIKDVGKTRASFSDSDYLFRTNGNPSINLIIRKKASGDIISLVKKVKDVVGDYQKTHPELKASFVDDMSVFVENRLGVLLSNGYMGFALVLIALLLFLSRGIAFVTALGMPVALLGALIVMDWLGMTINLLTMFSLVIVLGMLVDDAIIVAENIWQHYEDGKPPWQATLDGVKEVVFPVTATIMTSIAAFSPLLMVTGIFGKFISSIPKVVIVSLIISLIEALFILPSHAYDILKLHKKKPIKKLSAEEKDLGAGYIKNIIEKYGDILAKCLHYKYALVAMVFSVFALCLYIAFFHMKVILFPSDGVNSFFVRVNMPQRTLLHVTEEKIKKVEEIIQKSLPKEELLDYVSYIGLQEADSIDPLRVRGVHVGQIAVHLTPENKRKRKAEEIIESLREPIAKIAEAEGVEKITYVQKRIGPPVGKPVAIRIMGKNFETLSTVSSAIEEEIKTYKGISDVSSDFSGGRDELQIHINEDSAALSFLSTQDIATHLRSMFEGFIASYIYQEGDRIPVKVRYQEKDRKSIDSLKNSLVQNKAGYMVPLSQVTSIEKTAGVNMIKHRDGEPVVMVTASIDEKLISSSEVNSQIQPFIELQQKQYPDISITRGGEYEDTNESMASLQIAFFYAAFFIFIILATQFKSVTQPLVVMIAIPFGIIGVIISFYIHGLPLSFLGLIGVIGLSGVVVNDSIVLVDFINGAIERGMTPFDACIYAAKRRFRAVWLTSITTIFGLLPLAYGIGGDDAFLKPAAMALGYGLLFSTVLILLFVPAIYLIRLDMINGIKKYLFSIKMER